VRSLRKNLNIKSPYPGESAEDLLKSPLSLRRLAQSTVDGLSGRQIKQTHNSTRRLNPLTNSINMVFGPND
jgi:hypothetical protein